MAETLLLTAGASAGTAATVGTIATYVGTGMSVLSGLQQMQAGRQQQASYKFQAMQQDLANRQEKVKAKEAENEARKRFLSTMSSLQAGYSARGISLNTGTPYAAQTDVAGEFGRDIGTSQINTEMGFLQGQAQSQQLRMAGSAAAKTGFTQGLSTIGNLFGREFG